MERKPYYRASSQYIWCKENSKIQLFTAQFNYVLSAENFDKLKGGTYHPNDDDVRLPAYRIYTTEAEALQDLRDNSGHKD